MLKRDHKEHQVSILWLAKCHSNNKTCAFAVHVNCVIQSDKFTDVELQSRRSQFGMKTANREKDPHVEQEEL